MQQQFSKLIDHPRDQMDRGSAVASGPQVMQETRCLFFLAEIGLGQYFDEDFYLSEQSVRKGLRETILVVKGAVLKKSKSE